MGGRARCGVVEQRSGSGEKWGGRQCGGSCAADHRVSDQLWTGNPSQLTGRGPSAATIDIPLCPRVQSYPWLRFPLSRYTSSTPSVLVNLPFANRLITTHPFEGNKKHHACEFLNLFKESVPRNSDHGWVNALWGYSLLFGGDVCRLWLVRSLYNLRKIVSEITLWSDGMESLKSGRCSNGRTKKGVMKIWYYRNNRIISIVVTRLHRGNENPGKQPVLITFRLRFDLPNHHGSLV